MILVEEGRKVEAGASGKVGVIGMREWERDG